MRKSNKSYDLRVKGALKQESNLINFLIIISIVVFSLSVIIEYLFPILFSSSILEAMHYDFLTDAFLGFTCSALVSFFCFWKAFIFKKESQHKKLTVLVKILFLDYINLLSVIDNNLNIEDEDNTYLGECNLINIAKKIDEDSNILVYEYETSDVLSKNIEKIINGINSYFIPITQVISRFVDLIMPPEYTNNPDKLFFANKKENFDKEENKALYSQLKDALEKIISFEDLIKLFSDYIDSDYTVLEIAHNDMCKQLLKNNKLIDHKKIFSIQNQLFLNIIKIRDEFSNKRMAEELKKIEERKNLWKQKRN